MAAHRYWRILGLYNAAGAQRGYSGLKFLQGGVVQTTHLGTITGDAAVDGSISQIFNATAGAGTICQWPSGQKQITYDFGAGNAKDIDEIQIYPDRDGVNRTYNDMVILSSDDNATWTVEWLLRMASWTGVASFKSFPRPAADPSGYRAWRIRSYTQRTDQTRMAIAEIEMRLTVAGADQCSGGTPYYTSQNNGTTDAGANAFDNNNATAWTSLAQDARSAWIGYDFGSGVKKEILDFNIRIPNNSNWGWAPTEFYIDVTNDDPVSANGSNWLSIFNNIGAPLSWGAQGEAQSVLLEPPASEAVEVSQAFTLALAGGANTVVSQLAFLAMYSYPAETVELSQLELRALMSQSRDTRISQAAVLVLVKENPDKRRLRAWTFTLDGHNFYVLRLGTGGTVVYDTTTKRWSEWASFDRPVWQLQVGGNWGMSIVGGDDRVGLLWDVDPYAYRDDEDLPIKRIATGGVPQRLHNGTACNGVMLTGSVGHNDSTGVTVTLRTSDDNGQNWHDHGTITMITTGSFGEQIQWTSLGTIFAPGRIFQIEDTGVASRLDGLDMW